MACQTVELGSPGFRPRPAGSRTGRSERRPPTNRSTPDRQTGNPTDHQSYTLINVEREAILQKKRVINLRH
jgi:hypothetical protein